MLRGIRVFRAFYSTARSSNPWALENLKQAYMQGNKKAFFAVVKNTDNFSDLEYEQAAELAVEFGEISSLHVLIKKMDNDLLHGQLLCKAIACQQPKVVLYLLQNVALTEEDKARAARVAASQKSTIMTLYALHAMNNDLCTPSKLSREGLTDYTATLNLLTVKSAELGLPIVLNHLLERPALSRLINAASIGHALNHAAVKGFIDCVEIIVNKHPHLDPNFLIAASKNAKQRGHTKIQYLLEDILNPPRMPIFVSQRFPFGWPGYYKERDQAIRMLNEAALKKSTKKKH